MWWCVSYVIIVGFWYLKWCFSNVTVNDLAIPDAYCSPHNQSGYQCPVNMECKALKLSRKEKGFNGFGEFGMMLYVNFSMLCGDVCLIVAFKFFIATFRLLQHWTVVPSIFVM